MYENRTAVSSTRESVLATNKVLRNTYALLSMTLVFSGLVAALSTALNMPPMTYLLGVGGAMLLGIFVLPRTANSAAGVFVVFALTGLLGFSLGPILNMYLALGNGTTIVTTALGGTGMIFLGLSAYVLTTRKDFSFLGGFLFAGLLTVLLVAIVGIFVQMPALHLAISAAVILLMSGFILFHTSQIINGGETNYLIATVNIYMAVFNIFIHLLSILGMLGGED